MSTMPLKPRSTKATDMNSTEEQLLQAVESRDFEQLATRLCAKANDIRDETQRALVRLAITTDQPSMLQLLIANQYLDPVREGSSDTVGSVVLNLAVELGRVDCIRMLLAEGAQADAVSSIDAMRQTPLHLAAMYNTTVDGIHHTLIQSSVVIDARDLFLNTPLHIAAAYGSLPLAEALLNAGADVNAVNASGATPLSLAAPNGFVDIIDRLILHGANANCKDALGNTPLIDAAFVTQSNHFACGNAVTQYQVVKRLLQLEIDTIDAVNRDGDGAIAGAIRNGYIDAARELLDHGAIVNRSNRRGETVLHIAALAGVQSVVLWQGLVNAGANVMARDRYDRTCYQVWMSRPKTAIEPTPEHDSDGYQGSDPIAGLLETAMRSLK